MPESIGVRKLKNQASRIVKSVREEMAEYIVTHRGKPVAILRPLTHDEAHRIERQKAKQAMIEMKTLAGKIAEAWTSEKSGVELISEQRR